MASDEQVADIRRMVAEPTADTYTDDALKTMIDAAANLNTLAADIWTEKAAQYAELVDTKEGSSSRALGSLYDQALKMAKGFQDRDKASSSPAGRSRVRQIERP